ncbi:cytochrome P450, partial [Haematococcus lacustris]
EVSQATKVGNWVIPPGVIVWPMLYALHNSQHNWEAPEQFRPSRWLDRHSRSSKASSQADLSAAAGSGEVAGAGAAEAGQARAKAFLPFSDGIKSCLGQALGLMEVRTALVALLSRFHFELDPSVGSASE